MACVRRDRSDVSKLGAGQCCMLSPADLALGWRLLRLEVNLVGKAEGDGRYGCAAAYVIAFVRLLGEGTSGRTKTMAIGTSTAHGDLWDGDVTLRIGAIWEMENGGGCRDNEGAQIVE